jgi:hypothetical protein
MSVRVMRDCDRLAVKISEGDGVCLSLKPLNYWQKSEVMSLAELQEGEVVNKTRTATILAIKYSLRGTKGLVDYDGNRYELTFDEEGNVSDDSVTDILNIEMSPQIILCCYNMIHQIPKIIINPATGEPLDGVEVITQDEYSKKE